MTATARKEAMRGGGTPKEELGEDSQELEGGEESELTIEDLSEFDEDRPPDDEDPPDDLGDEDPLESLPLFPFTTEEENGDWVYTIQYPGKDKLPFKKVRVPKTIFAKDIRRSTQGRNDGETVFFMLCSVSKVPAKLMDKVDARDYAILSRLMQRRALGNSRAVLRSIGGVDSGSSRRSPPTGD